MSCREHTKGLMDYICICPDCLAEKDARIAQLERENEGLRKAVEAALALEWGRVGYVATESIRARNLLHAALNKEPAK